MVCSEILNLNIYIIISGDMDLVLPVPISRHFSKQYSLVNSNFTYIEMPRTGHTTIGKFSFREFLKIKIIKM